MGEQDSFSTSNSNPIFIVIMRNSRGKLFVYVATLGVLCFFVFLLSSTHTSLKELENVNEKCQQQRDSLSAQLQVVYEHKNRLEKSLQQEKTDHRHTKEGNEKLIHELEGKVQEEKDKDQKLESQIAQLKTRYSELEEEKTQSENAFSEQLKTVQAEKDKEIEKLQNHISELLSEKDKLEMSNNAKTWKLEQNTSELKFCQLQSEQSKTEFVKCQEQLQKFSQGVDNHLQPLFHTIHTTSKKEENNEIKVEGDVQPIQVHRDNKHSEKESANKSSSAPPLKVFSKPLILHPNNAADGVLPKPEEKDDDAAVEVPEFKQKKMNEKQNHINQRDLDNNINIMPDEKNVLKADVHRENENHPQVAAPHNFDIGDKEDHAGERGEYGPQYGLSDARQQVEVPVFMKNSAKKSIMPAPHQINSNDIEAQMQDMMNKSPGDVNHLDEHNVLNMPQQKFGALDNKIKEFRNAGGLLNRGDQNNIDDKNYEEDDDDRENDDDQGNGNIPEMRGPQGLQDHDFDDQENADNAKEEGVVAAPK